MFTVIDYLRYGFTTLKWMRVPFPASVTHTPPVPSEVMPLGSLNVPAEQPSQTFTG